MRAPRLLHRDQALAHASRQAVVAVPPADGPEWPLASPITPEERPTLARAAMPSCRRVSNRSSLSLGRNLAACESIPSGVHATEPLLRADSGNGKPSTALSKSLLALFFINAGAAVAVRHRHSMAYEVRPVNSRRRTPNPRPMQRPRTHWQPWRADRWSSVPTSKCWPYPQRPPPCAMAAGGCIADNDGERDRGGGGAPELASRVASFIAYSCARLARSPSMMRGDGTRVSLHGFHRSWHTAYRLFLVAHF